ncbi:MAG: hypothetical protein AAFX06_34430, partial [Planctomycetota bacterium]
DTKPGANESQEVTMMTHQLRLLEQQVLRLQEQLAQCSVVASQEATGTATSTPTSQFGANFGVANSSTSLSGATPPDATLASVYFAGRPRRQIDVAYEERKERWMIANSATAESQYLEKLAMTSKPDLITFSGHDNDWPEFKTQFRAMLHAARLDDIAVAKWIIA